MSEFFRCTKFLYHVVFWPAFENYDLVQQQ